MSAVLETTGALFLKGGDWIRGQKVEHPPATPAMRLLILIPNK